MRMLLTSLLLATLTSAGCATYVPVSVEQSKPPLPPSALMSAENPGLYLIQNSETESPPSKSK